MPKEIAISATRAKNAFGKLMDAVLQGATVTITRHDAPRAVLLSMESYEALRQAPAPPLEALRGEFDAMLARMQRPAARRGLMRAFRANSRQLGAAAVAAARRRG